MINAIRDRLDSPSARGLAEAVSRAVHDGVAPEGARLPPIRVLANELGLSPTTVSAAWALLIRAGTLHTDGRRGTRVAVRAAPGPTRYRRALERSQGFALDLSTGVPDPALLPDLSASLSGMRGSWSPGSYLDDPVLPELLEVLREDWPAPVERLTLLDGAMDALDHVTASVVRFGDRVAVEHPCFPPLLDLLESVGARVVGIDVDDAGPVPERLAEAVREGLRAFFLQPRAQNPTGVSLDEERGRALASVLEGTDVVVVEDDSAGAIAATPPVSLARWLPEQTLHIRSFSKSHGPDLRLAALGGPARLVDPVVERRFLGQAWTSRLLQAILLDLLTRPAAIGQVARARDEYARRREAVVTGLARRGVHVGGSDGLNIWLPVADESAALLSLASAGIGVAAGGPFAVRPGGTAHLRVTTGLVTAGEDEVAEALAGASRRGGWASPR